MYKSVYLKKGKEESLRRFHPWVFSGAIARMDDGLEAVSYTHLTLPTKA